MKKKIIILLALAIALIFTLSACSSAGDNIVVNGDFELYDDGMQSWTQYEAENSSATVEFSYPKVDPNSDQGSGDLGERYTRLSISGKESTAYLSQRVKLRNGQLYKFSVTFNIEEAIKGAYNDEDFFGAYFGFLEDKEFRELVVNKATDGWVTREIYFKSKTNSKMTLVAGIGSETFGGGKGTVLFDNITLTPVKEVPPGVTIGSVSPSSSITDATVGGILYTVFLTLGGIVLIYGAYFLIKKALVKEGNLAAELEAEGNNNIVVGSGKKRNIFLSPLAIFTYIIIVAFAVRFLFLMILGGMADKLTELGKVALTIYDDGLLKLYNISNTTLPTGSLYILSLIGLIGGSVDMTATSIGMAMLIRIPYIIADLIACYLIFTMFSKHYSYVISSIFAGIYALLPMAFTMSASWGMNMSIPLVFIIAMINFMLNKNHIGVSISYTLALLFGNISLIFLPLIVLYSVYYIVKDKKSRLPIIISVISSFIVFYLLALPFTYNYVADGNVFFVFKKMLADINLNNKITNDVFNFYAIFGLGNSITSIANMAITGIIMIALIGMGAFMYIKSTNRLDFLLLGSLSAILYSVFGIGAKMELFAIGIILLMIYAGLKGERRLYHIFAILSIVLFINVATVLGGSGYITSEVAEEAGYSSFYRFDALFIIGSIIVTAVSIYLAYVGYDIMVKGRELTIEPMTDSFKTECIYAYNNAKNRVLSIFKK